MYTKGETRPKLEACYVYANLTSNKGLLIFRECKKLQRLPKPVYKTIHIMPFQRTVQACILSLNRDQLSDASGENSAQFARSSPYFKQSVAQSRASLSSFSEITCIHFMNEPQNHSALFFFINLRMYVLILAYKQIL